LIEDALLLLLQLLELRLRRDNRIEGIVHVHLRAGTVGQQRVLALDVALLEIERLARERDAPRCRGESWSSGWRSRHARQASFASACVDARRSGSGSISSSASPALTR
jgi:hypothetical protein